MKAAKGSRTFSTSLYAMSTLHFSQFSTHRSIGSSSRTCVTVFWTCVLDEAGDVVLEQKVATTSQGIKQVFSRMPRSRVALETGAHCPWVNRQLTQLGHEVIVAHIKAVGPAQKSRFLRSDSLRLYSEVEVTTVPDLAIQPD